MSPRRRHRFDPLQSVNEPRWLVIRDRYSQPIEFTELAPGTDLRAALMARTAALAAQGWEIGDIPRNCSFLFCERENERWCVSIDCYEPGNVPVSHGGLPIRR